MYEDVEDSEEEVIREARRTHHPEIQPADVRLQNYQVKGFGRKFQQATTGVKTRDAELMEIKKSETGSNKGLLTAQLGSVYDVPDRLLQSEAETKAGTTVYTESTNKFAQEEGAVLKVPFKTFYTTGEDVRFDTVNKFEGKSGYFSYYPTGQIHEQRLEHYWFAHANKKLADKRRNEETQQFLKQWAGARGRMEAEIQRRKEHLNDATNFEQARGFVRTNFKSAKFPPNSDPTQWESSTDESDEDVGAALRAERQDQVPDNIASQHQEYTIDEHGREEDDEEEYEEEQESRQINQTMNRTVMSDTKARKRFL